MGRRKIEIQPITHERNRSVTFLKRKNGLFKKAYELGVLCSVDVAVIVFDNKQGGPRLYQYGSDDVITIVERAMRFEGDRDTKRPSDFNARNGTLEDHEEEDEEDEEHVPARTSKKRTESGSIKPPPPSQSRPQQAPPSATPPPNKRARVESIEIPSEATPASSSSVTSLPSALLHPSLQPLLAQTLQAAHIPSYNPQSSLAHLYNIVQQHSLPQDSPAALLHFLRTAGLQSGRFSSQQSNQNPHLSESLLASLAELAANPSISDGIGNGLSSHGLGGAGGAFDWPTGLGSGSNPQEPQPTTNRGSDDGPNWLDFLTAPPSNSVNGLPSLPPHNPQHPHPHPHHPTSFLNQRNFSTGLPSGSGYPPLSSFGGLSQIGFGRLTASEDPRSSRRPLPRDSAYSQWNSDASSQSGRSDSSMSTFRPSPNVLHEHDRQIELEEGSRNHLP